MSKSITLIIIGFVVSISLIIYECGGSFIMGTESMVAIDTGSIVAIVVALLSVAGAIGIQIYQFKKDSNTIGTVKSDTSGMVPVVTNIAKDTEKIKDEVVEKLVPHLTESKNMAAGVKELVDEQNYRKRLQNDFTIHDRDYLVAGVERVYEENALLSQKVREQQHKIAELQRDNRLLTTKNQELKSELSLYEPHHDQGISLDER